MSRNTTHKNKAPHIYIVWLIVFMGSAAVGYHALQTPSSRPKKMSAQEIAAMLPSFNFTPTERQAAQIPRAPKLATWGKQLFFDHKLSKNQALACASCHQPERHFTDGLPQAQGLQKLAKNAPTIINSRWQDWFYWNGRVDSLAAQALQPLMHPHEQGLNASELLRYVRTSYLKEYEELFGTWPAELNDTVFQADINLPLNTEPLSEELAAYVMATLSYQQLKTILTKAQTQKIPPYKVVQAEFNAPPQTAPGFTNLDNSTQKALLQTLANIGLAIAAYEQNLIAIDAPFDRFLAANTKNTGNSDIQFVDGFATKEWEGFQHFINSGCHLCHHGPRFTDDQFHNIGLPALHNRPPDLGRAEGVLLVMNNVFNCENDYLNKRKVPLPPTEGCRELEFLATDSLELVGAFKTPSLRNVAETGPYFHDGRARDLQAVIAHYIDSSAVPAVGHREESILDINLSAAQIEALEAFLISLTSPITDLTHAP